MARTRRAMLGAAAASITIAGCLGDDGDDGAPQTTTDGTDTTTAADTTVGDTTSGDTTTERTQQTTNDRTTTDDDGTTTPSDATETVDMRNTAFSPVRLEVPGGTNVVWENRDSYGHTVVDAQFHDSAASWSYDSGNVPSRSSAEYTFESSGVYEYYCDVHGQSSMCGVVLVGGASLDADLPCEEGGGIY